MSPDSITAEHYEAIHAKGRSVISFIENAIYPQYPRATSSKRNKSIGGGDGARSSAETNAAQKDGGGATSHEQANETQISTPGKKRKRTVDTRTRDRDYEPSQTDGDDDDTTSDSHAAQTASSRRSQQEPRRQTRLTNAHPVSTL
ncbi:hypothetical protein BDR22DRAFT_824774 [Usnea florida]